MTREYNVLTYFLKEGEKKLGPFLKKSRKILKGKENENKRMF